MALAVVIFFGAVLPPFQRLDARFQTEHEFLPYLIIYPAQYYIMV